MLTVTDRARQLLKDILDAQGAEGERGLRLSVKESGALGITLDREAEGDQVIEHEGAKVLLVDSDLAPSVEGITLEVRDTAEGPKLAASRKE